MLRRYAQLVLAAALLFNSGITSAEGSHKPKSSKQEGAHHHHNHSHHKHHKGHTHQGKRHNYVKPGADVLIKGQSEFAVNPNTQTELLIELDSSYLEGQLIVEVRASEGLELVGTQTQWQFELGGEALLLPISVHAAQEGRYYLMFTTMVNKRQASQGRALGVAVNVGDVEKAAKTKAASKTSNKSRSGVISMPARETIY